MRNDLPRSSASRRVRRLSLAEIQAQMMSSPHWTGHGDLRGAQRNLSAVDVAYVLQYGCEIYRTGVIFHYLRAKDILPQHRHLREIMRLAGAVVITSSEDKVITLYPHARKQRLIHRKTKYRIIPGWEDVGAEMDEMDEMEEEPTTAGGD